MQSRRGLLEPLIYLLSHADTLRRPNEIRLLIWPTHIPRHCVFLGRWRKIVAMARAEAEFNESVKLDISRAAQQRRQQVLDEEESKQQRELKRDNSAKIVAAACGTNGVEPSCKQKKKGKPSKSEHPGRLNARAATPSSAEPTAAAVQTHAQARRTLNGLLSPASLSA